jgi:hypothetical protein
MGFPLCLATHVLRREACRVYFRAAGLRQPHWQLRCWQLQAFFSQPQEQVLQSQVLPQLQVMPLFRAIFFELDILFLPFLDVRVICTQKG